MSNKIEILCSSQQHPVWPALQTWAKQHAEPINIVDKTEYLTSGKILFLVSCTEFIPNSIRNRYQYCLTLHASALPEGRGWSPHIWQILEGKNSLVVSLINADDPIDSGDIWLQKEFELDGSELFDEINQKLFFCQFALMDEFMNEYQQLSPRPQPDKVVTYHVKREPQDSKIDINKTIDEQFNQLRVADPNRFPAFFVRNGQRYEISIKKVENENHED